MKHLVTIPWKGRDNYFRITLATLNEALRESPPVDLVIHQNGDWHSETPGILEDMANMTADIEVVGMAADCPHRLYIDRFNDVFDSNPEIDHLINIDSDACVHPEFFKAVNKAIEDLPDYGCISLFNEDCHPEPAHAFGNYHHREHFSMFAIVLSRKAWEMYTPPEEGQPFHDGCVDGDMTTAIGKMEGVGLYSTIRSYAEHIGAVGTHAAISADGKSFAVRARRFMS
jgi:hypothetical protein